MKGWNPIGLGCLVVSAILSGSALSAASTQIRAQQLEESIDTDVIVIFKDQLPNAPAVRGSMGTRRSALAAAQAPMVAALKQAKAARIRSFGLINALATRVSKSKVAELAADPAVQAVVPDRVIRAFRKPTSLAAAGAMEAAGSTRAAASPSASPSAPSLNQICPSDPSKPLLEPEALQVTHTAFLDPSVPQAQKVLDGNGQPITGQGVKVAFLADGVDPNNPDFIRSDGSHVFVDYQDFSGDPAGTPTEGAEAFGDASSIAAQGRQVYDLSRFVNPAHPLPPGCNVRVLGMAPGASLVGLKVFSSRGLTTESTFVQAIEYAVSTANVDIINESFGGNPFPDNDNDPVSLANEAAIRAGVAVVVSTGDAGTAGTLGSPSTDTDVIAVGGTTTYRLYAQITNAGFQFSNGQYINNNITALSSGGFAQTRARTVDVSAPGDSGWALCSSDIALFTACSDFAGRPTSIQDFGGTSESAPLTSGEAALVVQAYRSTHHGADPSPALIKRIIMSTATDLGAPSSEQGAGLINSLAAVNAALSVHDFNGRPQGHGSGVVTNPTAVNITDRPHTPQIRFFTVTNTGTTVEHLAPTLQKLGEPFASDTLTLNLDPATMPTYLSGSGARRSYLLQTFTVPPGAQHLDAAIAWRTGTGTPIAYLHLFDPSGRFAQYSLPQGLGSGYGHVDVVNPAAGTWTALIATRPSGTGSYTGPVKFTWSAERYTTFGTVFPAHVDLQPGASTVLTALFTMPADPGDESAGIRFGSGLDQSGSGPAAIPISLRSLVPVGPNGGSFTGTLTGGNGRPSAGPTQTFAFDVPRSARNMSLNLSIADSGDALEGLLVDPQGMQLSIQPNIAPNGAATFALQHFHYSPQPGRWRFVLLQNFTAAGNQTSLPFTARISFYDTSDVASGHLPNSPSVRISASGSPVIIPLKVTNNGVVPQLYFADARLAKHAVVDLGAGPLCNSGTLQGACSLTWVPPEVSALQFTASTSSTDINMDAFNDAGTGVGVAGAPDIFARPVGTHTVAATIVAPEVPWGPWLSVPSLIGPYPASGAPTDIPVTTDAVALMQPFDPAVTSDTGNVWADLVQNTNTFNPILLAPGQSGTINAVIDPDPSNVGKTVSGFLYIDTINGAVNSGDEVVRLPYSYTVTR
jgi:hypothetical protein